MKLILNSISFYLGCSIHNYLVKTVYLLFIWTNYLKTVFKARLLKYEVQTKFISCFFFNCFYILFFTYTWHWSYHTFDMSTYCLIWRCSINSYHCWSLIKWLCLQDYELIKIVVAVGYIELIVVYVAFIHKIVCCHFKFSFNTHTLIYYLH